MILKSIEICEPNTDISNESAIENFKDSSFFFLYRDYMALFSCWLYFRLALDNILLRHIHIIQAHKYLQYLFSFNIML